MSLKNRYVLFSCILLPVVLLVGTSLTMDQLDDNSQDFFQKGKTIVDGLGQLAKAIRSRDLEGISAFYADGFQGRDLGLTRHTPRTSWDGVEELDFVSAGSALDRSGARQEWESYLGGLESIEEVGLHIHRLEEWTSSERLIASVRFELIGKPEGRQRPAIDRALFRMSFEMTPAGLKIRDASLMEGLRLLNDTTHFTNVSAEAGIDFKNQYYPAFLNQSLKFGMIRYGPAGITAADYDNDGLYDLFVPDGAESKLFRNLGTGRFEDVTAAAGLAGLDGVSVGLFADYDNDGHKDFFVSRTFQPNQLFRNNGNGTFTDVTAGSGIGADSCTTVASWADFNNDGYLDLYVGRYLDPRDDIPTTFYARNGLPNQLYRNNGNGTFTNVTLEAGVGELGLCLGTVWGDYDDDGDPDLYVVNDFGRNTLYRNEGNGRFTDVTVQSNTLAYGAGMNASFADYDNDGRLDIYVTNIRSEHAWFAEWPTVMRYMMRSFTQGVWTTDTPLYFEIFRQSGFEFVEVFQQMASGNTLLRNKGDGTFEDTTWQAAANPPGWFWSASFADFDNDGWQDAYMANGWVYNDRDSEIELEFLNNVVSKQDEYKTGLFFDPAYFGNRSWHGWERNRFLHNRGDGSFIETGLATGTDLITNSRGVAVADFWNRGVLDIAVSASTDRHQLLRNEVGLNRNWLGLELVGTKSNRDAVGARVTARIADQTQTREVVLGDGYGSQNSLRLYFGLQRSAQIDQLTVKWPASGLVQTFDGIEGGRIIQITEGENQLVTKRYSAQP